MYRDGSPERWVIGIPYFYLAAFSGLEEIKGLFQICWLSKIKPRILLVCLVIGFIVFPVLGSMIIASLKGADIIPYPNSLEMKESVRVAEDSDLLILPEIEMTWIATIRLKGCLFLSPDRKCWEFVNNGQQGGCSRDNEDDFYKLIDFSKTIAILDDGGDVAKACIKSIEKKFICESDKPFMNNIMYSRFSKKASIKFFKRGITSGSSGN